MEGDPPNLTEEFGDLLKLGDDVPLIHQTNCVTRRAMYLAQKVFLRYPYANVYAQRTDDDHDVPGTVAVRGDLDKGQRLIYNLFGQLYPGISRYRNDSPEKRLGWFREGLERVAKDLKARKDPVSEVCLPTIGCGAAGGDWKLYRQAIAEFAALVPDVRVRIVYEEKSKTNLKRKAETSSEASRTREASIHRKEKHFKSSSSRESEEDVSRCPGLVRGFEDGLDERELK